MRSRSDRSQFRSQSWWVCACAMAALLLALTAAGLAGESEAVVLVDFERFADDDELRAAAPTNPNGAFVEVYLESFVAFDGTKSMRLIPIGANGNQVRAAVTLPILVTDWSGAQMIELWMRNDGYKNQFWGMNIYEKSGEAWSLDATRDAYIETPAGDFAAVKCVANGINVPAGFEGRVRIPISTFSVPAWYAGTEKDEVLDLENIVMVRFGMNAVNNADANVYIDAFYLLK